MNSFRFLERGIEAEIARQTRAARGGRGRSSRRRSTSTRAPARITLAALEGGGARLPLLPRARPRAARRRPRRWSRRRAPRCPSCRPRAPSATSASSGLSAEQRPRCSPSAPSCGDYFEAALARATATHAADARQLGHRRAGRAHRRRRPGRVEGRAGRARAARRAGARQGRSRRAPPSRCSTRSSREGGDPQAIVEARGPRRDRRRRRAGRGRAARDRRRPRRGREDRGRQHEGDRRRSSAS